MSRRTSKKQFSSTLIVDLCNTGAGLDFLLSKRDRCIYMDVSRTESDCGNFSWDELLPAFTLTENDSVF